MSSADPPLLTWQVYCLLVIIALYAVMGAYVWYSRDLPPVVKNDNWSYPAFCTFTESANGRINGTHAVSGRPGVTYDCDWAISVAYRSMFIGDTEERDMQFMIDAVGDDALRHFFRTCPWCDFSWVAHESRPPQDLLSQ